MNLKPVQLRLETEDVRRILQELLAMSPIDQKDLPGKRIQTFDDGKG